MIIVSESPPGKKNLVPGREPKHEGVENNIVEPTVSVPAQAVKLPMELWPHQRAALRGIREAYREFQRILAIIPTGGGKTILFAHIAALLADKGRRVLILAHRDELVDQAIEKIRRATGICAGKEKAGDSASLEDMVVVASIQTIGRRLNKWPTDHFDLVVVDEAHHALASAWQTVLKHFDGYARVLGVTATPDRGDQRSLSTYFETVAAEVGLFDLVNAGFLAPIKIRALPLRIDLSRVQETAQGDFDQTSLSHAISPYLRSIAQAIKTEASGRRTLVFLPLVSTSREFTEILREEGLSAAHVDGESPDRKQILKRFSAEEFQVLTNANLLTEGFDDPGIGCVTILRPTRSRALYSQMVGRGTRIAPGKENLRLLDFLWAHERHNLARPAHLIAKTEAEAQAIMDLALRDGTADLRDLASEAREHRERTLREELERNSHRKPLLIDAAEYCLAIHQPETAEWESTFAWHSEPVTEKQRAALQENAFDLSTIRNRGHASAIMAAILDRRAKGLATPKQLRSLRRNGHPHPESATFEEARAFIRERISAGKGGNHGEN